MKNLKMKICVGFMVVFGALAFTSVSGTATSKLASEKDSCEMGSCADYHAWCKRSNDCLRQARKARLEGRTPPPCDPGPMPEKPANCSSCATPQ
jgi:hypothetical protein